MIAKALGIEPIIGIMAGSVSMIGGLGTAGAFGPYYEQLLGIPGTASAAVAAATFGMVAGTILGAPVGERIIKMHKVKTPYENPELMEDEGIDMIEDHVESGGKQFNAQDLLTICMWIGLASRYRYYRKCWFVYLNPTSCIYRCHDLCSCNS